jgi:hypothetical protein
MNKFRSASGLFVLMPAVALSLTATRATGEDSEIRELKSMIQILLDQNERQQQQIEELQRRLDTAERRARSAPATASAPAPAIDEQAALDAALAELEEAPPQPTSQQQTLGPAIFARRVGNANVRLIDLSFDILTAVGGSTERGSTLRDLQGGAHDPNRRGFTLQQGEFSLMGAVDPYFTAETHIIFGTDFVELEEAFFTTTSLPYDLQLEGGYFFTDFGRLNPVHPHAWHWVDQPLINTRLFGGEGLRSPGASLSWLTPLPWYSEVIVGVQNADEGELTYSFNNDEGAVGGRPAVDSSFKSFEDLLYHARSASSWDLSREVTAVLGFSGLFGSNSSGSDGLTFIYGTDLTVKWLPQRNFRGWPFLLWQTELMKRDYTADRVVAGTEIEGGGGGHGHDEEDSHDEDEDVVDVDLPSDILRDWGGYSQLLWGFRFPWAAGLRLEYASGSGPSFIDGELTSRQRDPLRGDRFRLSPLLIYHPTHFSRLRLQYNFDYARFLDGNDAHSVWLSAELMYGAHPAHEY